MTTHNDYLTKNNVTPGKLLDVESPIGRYINFRQEYLLKDFDESNNTGYVDSYNRIDGVDVSDTEIDKEMKIEIRKLVLNEQINSHLYKFLCNNLSKLPSLLNKSTKFQPPESTEVQNNEVNRLGNVKDS